MKILLAEDDGDYGFQIEDALEKRGHEVVWILGVYEMPANPENVVPGIGTHNTTVEFRLTDFGAALVDGNLNGQTHGSRIIRALAAIGIKSCAISSDDFANREMEEEDGATTSCRKHNVVSELDGILSKLS